MFLLKGEFSHSKKKNIFQTENFKKNEISHFSITNVIISSKCVCVCVYVCVCVCVCVCCSTHLHGKIIILSKKMLEAYD